MVVNRDALDDFIERERALIRIERLKDALREALDGWDQYPMCLADERRIAALRAQFLDDK